MASREARPISVEAKVAAWTKGGSGADSHLSQGIRLHGVGTRTRQIKDVTMRRHDVLDALANVVAEASNERLLVPTAVRAYDGDASPPTNQFLVLLKPELFESADPNVRRGALDFALRLIADHGIVLRASVVWPSTALRREETLERQYPTLAAGATEGIDALHPEAAKDVAKEARDYGGSVLGGHQILARHPGLTPYGLDLVIRSCGVRKVGAGVYTSRVEVDGTRYVVLNGFQPMQREHYYAPGQVLVAFEAWADTDFSTLRQRVLGDVDPRQAPVGSLRRSLLDAAEALGLRAVCTRRNGIHISPGPVETMAQLAEYVMPEASNVANTSFARCLTATGYSDGEVRRLATNPIVHGPRHPAPVNELTENLTWDDALTFLRTYNPPVTPATVPTRGHGCAG